MINSQIIIQLPLIARVLKDHQIKSAYAFGSVLTDRFNEDSDFDLLINFEEGIKPSSSRRLSRRGPCAAQITQYKP